MSKSTLTVSGSGMKRFNSIRRSTDIAYSILFILLALLCVIPVIFVIIISFSSEASIGKVGYSFVPAEWSTEAYQYVWHLRNTHGIPTVVMAFLTSIGITLVGTVLGLTLISTMGYVLSRPNFRLRKIYTYLIFIPMIFNGGLLSTYVINTQILGLKNTYWALILPLCCSSFYVIIMRTFFQTTVPDEIIEHLSAGPGHHRAVPHLCLLERLVSGQPVYREQSARPLPPAVRAGEY